jgi:hypothetical protein
MNKKIFCFGAASSGGYNATPESKYTAPNPKRTSTIQEAFTPRSAVRPSEGAYGEFGHQAGYQHYWCRMAVQL